MKATVWALYPEREKLPFKFKRQLERFLWLVVGSFGLGVVSLYIATWLYIPIAVKTMDKIIGGLS